MMKTTLILLIALVAVSSVPVEKSDALDAVQVEDGNVKQIVELDNASSPDIEGSESFLKIIEKKLAHWTKKCYKHGGCGSGFAGYGGGYPGYGVGTGGLYGSGVSGYGLNYGYGTPYNFGYGNSFGAYGAPFIPSAYGPFSSPFDAGLPYGPLYSGFF